MRNTLVASLGIVLGVASLAGAEEPSFLDKAKVKWEFSEGLDRPESAYFDADSKSFFISVIGGDGAKKDGNGWIAQLDESGAVKKAKWAEGLNAPKGLRAHKGTLWVSDIDEVAGFEITSGRRTQRVRIEGAQFLNDLAVGADGTVYVSDMFASKIYAIKDGKAEVFAEGDELEHPNGVLVDGDSLVLGGWGTVGDATPKTVGRLFKLDLKTKKKTLITKEPTGNLDGIERDGRGGYIVTDWLAGKVLRVSGEGEVTVLKKFEKNGTADHAYLVEQRLLVLPLMMENKVIAYELPE